MVTYSALETTEILIITITVQMSTLILQEITQKYHLDLKTIACKLDQKF